MWTVQVVSLNSIVLLLTTNCLWYATADNIPCMVRSGDEGNSDICVCNSTYCDTIERPSRLPKGYYYQYTTSNSSAGFSQTIGNFTASTSEGSDDVIFTVNSSVHLQELLGFGGSFTDSSGMVVNALPLETQEKLIESYFGVTGIEYTMCRVPVGSSDFSPRIYTLDDVPNDYELKYFNLSYEDYNYKVPVIKKAMSASDRGIKLIASTWGAPPWLKDNNSSFCGYIRSENFYTWTQYHVKYLEMYKNLGIDYWAITGGNEMILQLLFKLPGGELNCTYMTAPIQRHWFMKYMRPLLQASNFGDVKIITLDDSRLFAPYWMDRFSDPKARESIDGFGLHWYSDWIMPVSSLDYLHDKFPDKLMLYTESSINRDFGGKPVELGSWERAEFYTYNIIENYNHWTQGYIDWNIVLNTDGGPHLGIPLDASIIVNMTNGEFYKQPMFYGLGHFSKFMTPGARRIQVTSNQNESSDSTKHYSSKLTEDMLEEFMYKTSLKKSAYFFFPSVPSVVIGLGALNPDSSCAVIVFNAKNVTAHVRVEDAKVGSISVDVAPHSINSFIYWTS